MLLLFRPGSLTKAWLEGKRSSFFDPLRMFLLLGVLVFVAPDTLRIEEFVGAEEWSEQVGNLLDRLAVDSLMVYATLGILGMDLVMRLMPRRTSVVEDFVFALHYAGFLFLTNLVLRLLFPDIGNTRAESTVMRIPQRNAGSALAILRPVAPKLPTLTELADGIRGGDRMLLARAITLVESTHAEHHALAQQLLTELLPETGSAQRIGVTGVPGVGKSTFLDAFGMYLLGEGKKIAVLAVDPSSSLSGGSILGDKARMARLALEEQAFIRPSPSGATLGGVARRTRESMLLCEAAGFDVILIETVGVGQSETVVADMVDFFLVLMLPGAGDELQGIKKGILELADVIAVNKADGEGRARAERARRDYASALHYLQPRCAAWQPQAVCLSGLEGEGLDALWSMILAHRDALQEDGAFDRQRQAQTGRWMWAQIEERLLSTFRNTPAVQERLVEVEQAVLSGTMPPTAAADLLLSLLR